MTYPNERGRAAVFNWALINFGQGSPLAGQAGRAEAMNDVHISLIGKNEIGREGLRKILSSENFYIRESVAEVSALSQSDAGLEAEGVPHIIIVDSCYSSGLADCKVLVAQKSGARLVLLLEHYDFENVALAFQADVDAVIVKEISCGPLIESINLVAMGEKVFPSQLANSLISCAPQLDNGDWRKSAITEGLSSREIEILESIMEGAANKVIARQFDICEATVKVHVKAILRKLGVENRTQAATWAVRHSINIGMDRGGANATPISAFGKAASKFGQAA